MQFLILFSLFSEMNRYILFYTFYLYFKSKEVNSQQFSWKIDGLKKHVFPGY